MFGRLGIQVVTYRNDPAALLRLAQALSASSHVLRAHGRVERIDVRFGDCSEEPTLTDWVDDVRRELDGAVDAFDATAFGRNLGSAGGSNALAAAGRDDVIWVLNPDTYPSPRCALELLDALAADDVGAADGRQIPIEHPKAYDRSTGDTSWVCGACTVVRRDAFDEVGGFDAHHFPMYCDDVDLSWRLRLAGWRTVHAPRAVVVHDKRIDANGGVTPSPFELWSGTLAGLLLARRYARPDVEADVLARVAGVGSPDERAAVEEFERRIASGDVPDAIESAEGVAMFVDGGYAEHRFGYGT